MPVYLASDFQNQIWITETMKAPSVLGDSRGRWTSFHGKYPKHFIGSLPKMDGGTPTPKIQGAVSIRKTVLPGMVIPMLKIRRPNGRLIFNMEIAIRR